MVLATVDALPPNVNPPVVEVVADDLALLLNKKPAATDVLLATLGGTELALHPNPAAAVLLAADVVVLLKET